MEKEKSADVTNTQVSDDESPPSKTLEKPKIISSRRKRDALLTAAVYHLFPVLITALYTVAYAREWTWPHPGPSQEVLAALQFVAKVHECVVIASLANIFYHRIRYLLIQADGVPLGLITSPFQAGNPLYFLSPEFLGTLRSLLSTRSNFITFALLGLVAALSTAANPISAIILIPRKMVFLLPQSHRLMQQLLSNTTKERWGLDHFTGVPDDQGAYLFETLSIPARGQYPASMGPELGVTWTCQDIPDRPGNCVSFFQDLFPDLFLKLLGSHTNPVSDIPADPSGILENGLKYDFVTTGSNMAALSMQFSIERGSVSRFGDNDLLARVTCPFQLTTYMFEKPTWTVMDLTRNYTAPDEQLELIMSLSFEGLTEKLPNRQPQVLVQECAHTIDTRNLSVTSLTSIDWQSQNHTESVAPCFGTGFYPAFPFKMTDKIASQLIKQNWTSGFTLFVDLQDQAPFPISGAYIASYASDMGLYNPVTRLAIGYFVASWAEAGLSSRLFTNPVPEPPILPGELSRPMYALINMTDPPADPLVRMDANWLNSLDIFPFEVSPAGGLPSLSNDSRSLFTQLQIGYGNPGHVGAIVAAVMSAAHVAYNTFAPQSDVCTAPNLMGCLSSSFF